MLHWRLAERPGPLSTPFIPSLCDLVWCAGRGRQEKGEETVLWTGRVGRAPPPPAHGLLCLVLLIVSNDWAAALVGFE
jgi:hypothetical protein